MNISNWNKNKHRRNSKLNKKSPNLIVLYQCFLLLFCLIGMLQTLFALSNVIASQMHVFILKCLFSTKYTWVVLLLVIYSLDNEIIKNTQEIARLNRTISIYQQEILSLKQEVALLKGKYKPYFSFTRCLKLGNQKQKYISMSKWQSRIKVTIFKLPS